MTIDKARELLKIQSEPGVLQQQRGEANHCLNKTCPRPKCF
jgi:hypothetical protein